MKIRTKYMGQNVEKQQKNQQSNIENRKNFKTKSWLFEKINKIGKTLPGLTKKKEKAQINKTRN